MAMRPRSVTGIDVGPFAAFSTISPLVSPAPAGTRARTVTVAECPGRTRANAGVTGPNGTSFAPDRVTEPFPVVPWPGAASLMITAVQLPACGWITSAVPYPLSPCGYGTAEVIHPQAGSW